MSLIPAFEIGVWNAWILAIAFLLLVYVPVLILKDFNKKMEKYYEEISRKAIETAYGEKKKK